MRPGLQKQGQESVEEVQYVELAVKSQVQQIKLKLKGTLLWEIGWYVNWR